MKDGEVNGRLSKRKGDKQKMIKDTYNIEGMTCASCVQSIEKNVKRLAGVSKVAVNLATEKMNVEFDNRSVTDADIRSAVSDAGYKATKNMLSKTFEIEGMTCASCVQSIEKSVGKLAGVSKVAVNLATEKMTVTFDEELASVSNIIGAVTDTGYKAIPENSETASSDDKDKRQAQIKDLWTRFIRYHCFISQWVRCCHLAD